MGNHQQNKQTIPNSLEGYLSYDFFQITLASYLPIKDNIKLTLLKNYKNPSMKQRMAGLSNVYKRVIGHIEQKRIPDKDDLRYLRYHRDECLIRLQKELKELKLSNDQRYSDKGQASPQAILYSLVCEYKKKIVNPENLTTFSNQEYLSLLFFNPSTETHHHSYLSYLLNFYKAPLRNRPYRLFEADYLHRADFQEADLQEAYYGNTNFQEANLQKANLQPLSRYLGIDFVHPCPKLPRKTRHT